MTDKTTDLVNRIDMLDERLNAELWMNPQWIRNRLILEKKRVTKELELLLDSLQ